MQTVDAASARDCKVADDGRTRQWRSFLACEAGGTAIEYGLIAALMTMALITGLTQLSAANSSGWNNVAATLAASMP